MFAQTPTNQYILRLKRANLHHPLHFTPQYQDVNLVLVVVVDAIELVVQEVRLVLQPGCRKIRIYMDADPLGGPTRDKYRDDGVGRMDGWWGWWWFLWIVIVMMVIVIVMMRRRMRVMMMVLMIDFWGVQTETPAISNALASRRVPSTVLDWLMEKAGMWVGRLWLAGRKLDSWKVHTLFLCKQNWFHYRHQHMHYLYLTKCIIAMATMVIVVFICSQPASSFSIIIHHHSSVHWWSHEQNWETKSNQKWSYAISEQPKTSRTKKTSEYFFSTTKIDSGIVKKVILYFLVNHQNIRDHEKNNYHFRSIPDDLVIFLSPWDRGSDRRFVALISWGRPTNSKVPTMREGGWDVLFFFGWRFWLGFLFSMKNTWNVVPKSDLNFLCLILFWVFSVDAGC